LVRIFLLVESREAEVVNGKISLSAGDEPTIGSSTELASRSKVLRGALARFFQRHVHDLTEVDDLIQEVFLRIVRRGDTDQLEKLDGYIFQTASSVLKDRGRRRKARWSDRHIPFDSDRHDGPEIGPEQILIGQQSLRAAGFILLELPERTRRVFILRRLEGLPYQEIGQRLGLSVSAVEKHMQRAVRHLVTRTRGNP
jgi:RNA polymerase sigma-70 factor (ECF subfamily)